MSDRNEPKPLADRRVGPVAYVQRMGSYQGVPHYGCLLTIEAEQRMKVNDPLYGQAELDAAVAAESERCAKLRRLLQGAELLFAPLCRDATAWSWLDEARAALAETEGPTAWSAARRRRVSST